MRHPHLDFLLRRLYTVSLEFDWDAANIEHIAKHRATPAEVQQVFVNEPMIIGAQEHPEEERFLCFGRTNSGRFLTVTYTERQGKIPVVTC